MMLPDPTDKQQKMLAMADDTSATDEDLFLSNENMDDQMDHTSATDEVIFLCTIDDEQDNTSNHNQSVHGTPPSTPPVSPPQKKRVSFGNVRTHKIVEGVDPPTEQDMPRDSMDFDFSETELCSLDHYEQFHRSPDSKPGKLRRRSRLRGMQDFEARNRVIGQPPLILGSPRKEQSSRKSLDESSGAPPADEMSKLPESNKSEKLPESPRKDKIKHPESSSSTRRAVSEPPRRRFSKGSSAGSQSLSPKPVQRGTILVIKAKEVARSPPKPRVTSSEKDVESTSSRTKSKMSTRLGKFLAGKKVGLVVEQ